MSNRARRRHLHKPRENRTPRARSEYEHGKYPMVPGVITDREPATIQEALEQGHHVLPYIPGTQVNVRVYDIEEGMALLKKLFSEENVTAVRNMLMARGGTDPAIVITSREPHV